MILAKRNEVGATSGAGVAGAAGEGSPLTAGAGGGDAFPGAAAAFVDSGFKGGGRESLRIPLAAAGAGSA